MKKSDEKRQLILDTAYRLFSSKGFDRTSMSEVTAEVGGSKATIYNYFTSKEELFVECMYSVIENYLEGIFSPLRDPKTSMPLALGKSGDNALRMLCDPQMVATRRLLIAEAGRLGIGKLWYEKISLRLEELAVYLEMCMKDRKLRKADPNIAATQLRALLEAEVSEPLLLQALDATPSDRMLKKAAARAVETFLRAYAPEEGISNE
ncbi:MAG TPA: TetR/AcrR family transcriptional regulator [Candidatus Paceibacterota bacterium]